MFSTDKESFPDREMRILELWKKGETFHKSLKIRENNKHFTFYDGPPFATGLPHYGHLLAGTIKDVIPRYKTMKGYYVSRRFGWDCHGLPVENEIEKARELSGAYSIEKFGIGEFNEECRSIVLRYTQQWKETVERMGRWVDFEKTYKTMDKSFMESVWWVFKQLWEKDLVYQGFKVMPFSAKLGTPLSNFEANLNYKDVDDPSLTVQLPIVGQEDTYLLIWTTTPWTLPSNLAVCVHPEITYVRVFDPEKKKKFVLAKSRLKALFSHEVEVEEEFKGARLTSLRYQPLFSHFKETASPNAYQVLQDEFVGEEDGTGIVHMAPAFGEADFFVCKREEIEIVCPVDHNGKFTSEVPEYEGLFVKDADKAIIKKLKEEDRVFHQGTVRHRYPFCWRSDTPLIYRAVSTWFVSVEKIKEQVLASNDQIHWVPGHIQYGRFGKWLEGARDWAISRNRYWGTPIPIWESEDGEFRAIGSVEELEQLSGKEVSDLHRHFIDDYTFEENGKVFRRVPEVFDCWFESGSMPYAQNHYPFENKEMTEENFPADFIAEGLDQTRGWFYTLTILATALFEKPAFKNVIVNGIILAEDGAKMSKRLKNYPEPNVVIDKYGADAIRLFLLHSPAVQAEDLKFSERGVELVLRQILIPYWNSYQFLATYAKIYSWKPSHHEIPKPKKEIDQWILSRLQTLIANVTTAMDSYRLSQAVDPLVQFIDELTNWYIRRSRPRFWAEEDTPDRREAFSTLYYVLKEFSKVIAPFVPFTSEAIYQELKGGGEAESVHLCDFPEVSKKLSNEALEEEMQLVKSVVSMGHALRKEHKIKVRQPLKAATVVIKDPHLIEVLNRQRLLIMDELNVKGVEIITDETSFLSYEALPNFPVLGRRFGKKMKALQAEIKAIDLEAIQTIEQGGTISLSIEGEEVELGSEEINIRRHVKEGVIAQSDGRVTIALDTQLNEELELEGLAREIVNKVNTMRKAGGFEVTDRIQLVIDTTQKVETAFNTHRDFICNEILAVDVSFEKNEGERWDLNGEAAAIAIAKSESVVS